MQQRLRDLLGDEAVFEATARAEDDCLRTWHPVHAFREQGVVPLLGTAIEAIADELLLSWVDAHLALLDAAEAGYLDRVSVPGVGLIVVPPSPRELQAQILARGDVK